MKGDGVLNLLIFQAFQDVRMASSLVHSTTFNTRVFNDSGFFIASRHFTLFIKKEHIWSTKTKNFFILRICIKTQRYVTMNETRAFFAPQIQ